MTRHDPLLDLEPDELGRLLLHRARTERAPVAARQRALSRVAGIMTGTAAVSGVSAQTAAVAAKSVPWLIAKSLVVGMGASALLLTAAQQVRMLSRGGAGNSAATISSAREVRPAPLSVVPTANLPGNAPLDLVSPATAKGSDAHRDDRRVRALGHSATATRTPSEPSGAQRSPVAPEPADADEHNPDAAQLTREVEALKGARSALAHGDVANALHELSAYDRDFPAGALRIEAAALRIEALLDAGQRARAETLASSFLQNYPASPLATRVRALLKIGRDGRAP
jgi:TolA-binding protein